eukprot:m.197790 g.197790  ORF g.197790 m.197790 type:complete len:898 (+) comp17026_c0_seq4:772-3465(+)
MSSTVLLQPFRAVGLVTSHVPFALQVKGNDHFVTTTVGDAFHVYNCKKLNLVFVGQVGKEITAITCSGPTTFVSFDDTVAAYQRERREQEYPGHGSMVRQLLVFGNQLLVLYADNTIKGFDIATAEVAFNMNDFDVMEYTLTSMLHPSTYLNKLLIGSQQGSLQLWNIRTQKLIYSFKSFNSAITCLEQAPALDVVAVGQADGHVRLHHLKADRTLIKFHHDGGPITAITFRTDGPAIMATTNTLGTVALWDLDTQRLVATMSECHDGSLSGLKYLPSRALLLTAGQDNKLKLFAFDSADGTGRLLRHREGHSAPPTKLRFYNDQFEFLSAGSDHSLRMFSVLKDERSVELSQGSLVKKAKAKGMTAEQLKLPLLSAMSAEPVRQGDWDNIVTAHANMSGARLWSYEDKKLSQLRLGGNKQMASKGVFCTAVATSACGNFAAVGRSNGSAVYYNMQSGRLRKTFGSNGAHDGIVTGIAVDALNTICLTAGADCKLKIWSLETGKLKTVVTFPTELKQLVLFRNNNLAAVVGDDCVIRLFDVETKRVVRVFKGHDNRITDVAWFPDGRWLVSTSMDTTIRIWDVPTGRLLSWFGVAEAATSVTVSHNGEYLATSHVDSLGICLWVNRTLYANVAVNAVTPEELAQGPPLVQLPMYGSASVEEAEEDKETEPTEAKTQAMEQETDDTTTSLEPLDDNLITLSNLPKSRWVNLGKLEQIRNRNRASETVKAPSTAPFFLSTVPGLEMAFKLDEDPLKDIDKQSRVLNFGKVGTASAFQQKLQQGFEANDYSELLDALKSMGLAAIDLEIRSLSEANDLEQMEWFIAFLVHSLSSQRNFELAQAYMDVFLTCHGQVLGRSERLRPQLEALSELQDECWLKLDSQYQNALCMIEFFRSMETS